MKIVFQIFLALLTTVPAYAWMHPYPDHPKEYEEADLVAIVRVRKVADTGSTNRLNSNSQILFREFEVEMQVLSLLKGAATNAIKCRLYRFPSEQERNADLGERDARMQYGMARPWESGLFVPKQNREYLVYLKRSEAGHYLPAGGVQSAVYSILELKVAFVTDPDREAERDRAANGNQPIRSETNRTSSAVGSRP